MSFDDRLAWRVAKFDCHRAVIAARRRKFPSALRYLDRAQGRFELIGACRSGFDQGFVDLLRAEVFMAQATDENFVKYSRGLLVASMVRLEPSLPHTKNENVFEELRRMLDPSPGLPAVLAHLRDAECALDRGAKGLESRRKNVFWSLWYFHRRLRLVELALWATALDSRRPIPYLGLEECPRKTETIADRIVEDALRMARLDVYRMATIVEAYAGIVLALRLRLACDLNDRVLDRLMPNRQEAMRERLGRLVERLERIKVARKEADDRARRSSPDSKPMDAKVEEYADLVLEYGRKVVNVTRDKLG